MLFFIEVKMKKFLIIFIIAFVLLLMLFLLCAFRITSECSRREENEKEISERTEEKS